MEKKVTEPHTPTTGDRYMGQKWTCFYDIEFNGRKTSGKLRCLFLQVQRDDTQKNYETLGVFVHLFMAERLSSFSHQVYAFPSKQTPRSEGQDTEVRLSFHSELFHDFLQFFRPNSVRVL